MKEIPRAGGEQDTAIVVINLLVDMIERSKPFPMPPEYDRVLARTVAFINAAREAGYPIILIQDQHRPDDKEFTDFSVGQAHAIRGSEGAQLVSQLLPLGAKDYTVGKRRFSAFFGTDLDLYLREEGIRRLAIVGRPSNVCALYSAADGFMRRYEVLAISDCLYSKTGEMHERAMAEFAATLGPVMAAQEFLAVPSPSPAAAGGKKVERPAVLVVNVNKDLVANNLPESGTRLAARLETIADLLHSAREKGLPVIYAMDAHVPGDWEFRLRLPHGIAGSEGAQVADELAPLPGDAVFYKRGYDAFFETGLDPWLREQGITRLAIAGGPTNIDLRHTVVSAYNLRLKPIVIKECTAASTEELEDETLQDMFFCWRVSLDKFKEWMEG
jgi:nicotinamidase-related amidase